jgi:hypothetical protein
MRPPLELCATGCLVSTVTESSDGRSRGAPGELIVVWTMLLVVAVAIVVTYSRLPAADLYHVSGSGLGPGLGRLLVWLNYPLALVALPATLLLVDRLASSAARVVGAVGVIMSAFVLWPGVVDQSDLDAKAINVVPAVGTLIAVGLTIALLARSGVSRAPRLFVIRGDGLRVVIIVTLPLLAVPWLLADLGFSLDGVPVLGSIWQTGELRSQPGVDGLHPAVHHGHHHGMDGVLLTVTALLLSRRTWEIASSGVRRATAALLGLMLAYGILQTANDFWLEQVVKRKWTNWEIPDVTRPSLGGGWAVIVAAAVVIYAVWFSRSERRDVSSGMGVPESA